MYRISLLILLFLVIFRGPAAADIQANDTLPHSAYLLSRYIRHASVTGNERSAGLFFSTIARQKGLHVNILTDEPGSFNFTASLFPLETGKPNMLLLNHIDVVAAEENGDYTYPPFEGVIADGKVWGRGAIDNKGMAVMQLLAMVEFLKMSGNADLPFNITMLSVSGEETGGHQGAMIVADEFIDLLNPVVVYGEGGSGIPGVLRRDPDRKLFGISVTYKRSLWLELTMKMNTAGHGAVTPDNYVIQDKIHALTRLIKRNRRIRFSETTRTMFYELGEVEGGLRGLALKNLRLFRPLVVPAMKREPLIHSLIINTVTITAINTPEGAPNQIPQEITAMLDCRLLPETDNEEFIARLYRVLGNENLSIKVLHQDIIAPPSKQDTYFNYMRDALEEVFPGSAVIPILTPASNDNNYFRAKGIPVFGILPVFIPVYLLETIHNVDERIPVSALENGLAVYRELISIIMESVSGEGGL